MRTDRTTIAAGLAAAGLLGLGLYVAVPAMADDPSTSASPSPSATDERHDRGDDRPFFGWGHGWRDRGDRGDRRPIRSRGVHGEFTVRDSDDRFRVVTFQSGEITALTSTTLTVKSADGTTWTWTAADDVKVRKNRDKAAFKDLAQGDDVRVAGERSGGTRTAKVVRALS
ncbi:MAG TPA: DUF5666 domain-containing protein [Spirillospora sp.]